MSPTLAFCWPAEQGQRQELCVLLERVSHYFTSTGLFYFSVGTNIRVITIFIATREGVLEPKGCGKFEETEERKAWIPLFFFLTFWYVHELPVGLVLQCPLLSASRYFSLHHSEMLFTQMLTSSFFLKDAGKMVPLKLIFWLLVQWPPKWTRMPLSQVCPHEEIISALWFENHSYVTILIINNGLLNFSPRLYTKQRHSDIVSNCMVYTVKLPSVPSVFLLAQVPRIKLWHSR